MSLSSIDIINCSLPIAAGALHNATLPYWHKHSFCTTKDIDQVNERNLTVAFVNALCSVAKNPANTYYEASYENKFIDCMVFFHGQNHSFLVETKHLRPPDPKNTIEMDVEKLNSFSQKHYSRIRSVFGTTQTITQIVLADIWATDFSQDWVDRPCLQTFTKSQMQLIWSNWHLGVAWRDISWA